MVGAAAANCGPSCWTLGPGLQSGDWGGVGTMLDITQEYQHIRTVSHPEICVTDVSNLIEYVDVEPRKLVKYLGGDRYDKNPVDCEFMKTFLEIIWRQFVYIFQFSGLT